MRTETARCGAAYFFNFLFFAVNAREEAVINRESPNGRSHTHEPTWLRTIREPYVNSIGTVTRALSRYAEPMRYMELLHTSPRVC